MRHASKQARSTPPAPPTPPRSNHIKIFNLFRIFGYLGIVVVFGGLSLWNHFRPTWMPVTMWGGIKAHALQVAQFGVILLLVIRWVLATDREFKLWTRELEITIEQKQVYAAIAALSLGLGASLAFSFDVLWVSLAMTIFLLVNYWSQWLSNDYFARALGETKKKGDAVERRKRADSAVNLVVLDVMKHYWLERAQLARITTLMFFAAMAFSLA